MQLINIYNSQDVNVTIDDNGTPVDVYINSTPVDVYVSGGLATSVEFYSTFSNFPVQGQSGILYIAEDTNYIYRWDGSYVQVGGGSLVWGQITGTLSNQTDLQTALDDKVPYTGATQNINIGNNELIADDGTNDSAFAPSFIGVEDSSGYSFLDPNGVYVADISGQMEVNASGLVFPDTSIQTTAGITGVDWGDIQGTLINQTDLQTALDGKIDENTAITGATKTKITYDSKGLVTSGADAGIADITGLQTALDGKVPYTGATGNVDLGEYGASGGYYQFDVTPTTYTQSVGKMGWNDTEGTIEFLLKGGNVDLTIGEKLVARVVNGSGGNVLKSNYQVVKVTGAQGQRLQVNLAQANNDANSADTLGLIAENISNNQSGFIVTSGLIEEINTTGSLQSETWADGDPLYLSPTTAGKITNVKPQAPQHTVIIGFVVYSHANHGKIFVKVDNGYELNELHNVRIDTGTLSNGQVLKYNSTLAVWENNTDAAGTGTVTSIATSSPLTGGTITTSGTIGISQATTTTDGFLSSTDWSTFNSKESALTFSSPLSRSVNTISIPVASGSANGYLSSTDWTTFNNKQNALTNPVTGTGTSGQIAYWNGTSSQTGSATLTYSPTTSLLINNSVTASGAIARGTNLTPTLTAAANNDVLVGLDIAPTFTLGAFTGTSSLALRTQTGNVYLASTSGSVGIGVAPTSTYKLDVNGTARVQNELTVISPSGYTTNPLTVKINGGAANGLSVGPYGTLYIQAGGSASIALSVGNTIQFARDVTFPTMTFQSTANTIGQYTTLGAYNATTGSQTIAIVDNNATASTSGFTFAGNLSSGQLSSKSLINLRHWGIPGNFGVLTFGSTNGTQTYTLIDADITVAPTATGKILRGFYYNPSISGTALASHYAIQTVTGDLYLASTSGSVGIGVAPSTTYKLDVNGTARVQGNLTISGTNGVIIATNTAGLKANTNSVGINSYGANAVTNSFVWGLLNSFNQPAATNNLSTFYATIAYNSGTSSATMINIIPDINTTAGTNTVRGIYYNPALISLTGTTHRAIETVSGDALFGTTSGSVGIGANTSIAASAILDITSTTKGFLPPRMTGAQGEAITSPATGLMIYATNAGSGAITSAGWWGYNGTTWVKLN